MQSAHISAPYRSMEWVTDIRSLRFLVLGPHVFLINLLNAVASLAAFSELLRICAMKVSFVSNSTPKYFFFLHTGREVRILYARTEPGFLNSVGLLLFRQLPTKLTPQCM